MVIGQAPVATVDSVVHAYDRSARALDGVSVEFPSGCMIGLIGPDGVGKSTLMGLVAGSKKIQSGRVLVLGGDMADPSHRRSVCTRIAYMPQGLGKNLYPELSVYENIDFFARLFGLSSAERKARIPALLAATGLAPFPDRPAGKLSGGMKQKVSLCASLIHDPDLLILDEPTTGVDPLSRRQFWSLIDAIRESRPGMSVLVSTAYMDEAQQFDWLIAMNAGRVLASGTVSEIQERTGTHDLEQAFVQLLPAEARGDRSGPLSIPPRVEAEGPPAIVARDLKKMFGSFTAVDDVSFTIPRGEIFGFLGSNGCGKSTTMKMLTGLLPPTSGEALLFGEAVEAGSVAVRKRVGYMSQAFSLYGELTVSQNLWLHARLFHLPPDRIAGRIDALVDRFGLRPYLDQSAEELPLGLRQRLSLAVAVIHNPEILILDEPTSGVDPVARDEFWEMLIELSRGESITIFVTTHFMNEALRCDRISLMHAGKVLACDEPRKLIEARGVPDLESAFIAYIEDAIGEGAGAGEDAKAREALADALASGATHGGDGGGLLSPRRLLAYSRRETLEILRDPVRLAFAFVGSMLLMVIFGFGITTDVEHVRYATLDEDRSPQSRALDEAFANTRSFRRHAPAVSSDSGDERLKADDVSMVLEIMPNFERNLLKGQSPEARATIDGSSPFRAETIRQYADGVYLAHMEDVYRTQYAGDSPALTSSVQGRFRYNPTFESIYAIAPSVPPMLLVLIPAILMAVSVSREKELGSIVNFYVSPTTRLDFLIGKQLPYIAIGMLNFFLLTALTVFVFGVPIKGSGLALLSCALLYVAATTALGLAISGATGSQVAAVFVTTILTMVPTTQFSGMLQPVSTLVGSARVVGSLWPTTYYMHASVGAFTKGLGPRLLLLDAAILAAFVPVLMLIAVAALRPQEA